MVTVPPIPPTYQLISTAPDIVFDRGLRQQGGVQQAASGNGGTEAQAAGDAGQGAQEGDGQNGEGGYGRVSLRFTDGYDFSTAGLDLAIHPTIRRLYSLPETNF